MKGRKPVPTSLKLVRGNPGKRPIPKDEPKVRSGIPRCPDHLNDTAKKEWVRVARELKSAGLMSHVDRAALSAYCQAWGRWVEAETQLTKTGTLIKSPKGYPIQNPYLAIANRAMDQMQKLLIEFGMTPSSRTRVKSEKPKEEKSELREFLEKKA